MTETKEQMTDLMATIQLPEEGIRQLLDAREQLEKEGHWDVIVQTAEQVMTADGELSVLTKTLEETEGREETFGVNRYLLDALMLFCCWEEVKVRYEKQGLPMDVFDKSLEDMKWKMLECYEIHGVYGNFVGHWYDGFFNLTRFGLGRLQFELRPFEGKEDCEVDGVQIHPGDTVINMHIPSAGPMKPELLDDAFARAEVFFKEHFPKDYTVFGVESWLIDPDLVRILPEGNMKAYADRFHLVAAEKSETIFPDGWRVFGAEWKKKPEELPRKTGLQRAIADYLQQGANWEVVMAYLSGKNKHLKLLLQNRSFRECAFDGF